MFRMHFKLFKTFRKVDVTISNCPYDFYVHIFSITRSFLLSLENLSNLIFNISKVKNNASKSIFFVWANLNHWNKDIQIHFALENLPNFFSHFWTLFLQEIK